MVVLLHGDAVDIAFRGEGRAAALGFLQGPAHLLRVGACPNPQIDAGILALGVQQVVALVLGVVHVEMLLDIFRQGMHLEGQVLAVHGVQHVEADGEFPAEAGVYPVPQQLLRMGMDQVQRGGLEELPAEIQKEAVLLRHAVEAPGVVAAVLRQAEAGRHPVPAPYAGVEVGHHAEGLPGCLCEGCPVSLP